MSVIPHYRGRAASVPGPASRLEGSRVNNLLTTGTALLGLGALVGKPKAKIVVTYHRKMTNRRAETTGRPRNLQRATCYR